MSSDEKEQEMICALTADEYNALQKGLRELPDTGSNGDTAGTPRLVLLSQRCRSGEMETDW